MNHPIKQTTFCTEPGCDKPEYCKSLCKQHYKKAYDIARSNGNGIKDGAAMTYVQCAAIMGLTPARCRQLELSALTKLRNAFAEMET